MLRSIRSGTAAVPLMVVALQVVVTMLLSSTSCDALQQSPTTSTRRQHFGDVLVGSLATAVVATTAAPPVALAEGGAKVSSTQYPPVPKASETCYLNTHFLLAHY